MNRAARNVGLALGGLVLFLIALLVAVTLGGLLGFAVANILDWWTS